jgi:hypothetical protein
VFDPFLGEVFMVSMKSFDVWAQSRFGRTQMAEIEREAAAESAQQRRAIVEQIRDLSAERDKRLADLEPRIAKATERAAKASKEFMAAHDSLNCLRRKRSSANESGSRGIAELERQLRASADPAIDVFIERTRRMEDALHSAAIVEEEQLTERSGRWGVVAEIFSNRPSIDARLAAVRTAREGAESLKLLAVADVAAELEKIASTIPAGDLDLLPTGVEVEVPAI